MFLNSINYFRAIAILTIVAGHSHGIADLTHQTLLGKTAHNLVAGGSHFFVFISGFLFHHVFYRRFHLGAFMSKKATTLLIPYSLMSLLPVLYFITTRDWEAGGRLAYFAPAGTGFFSYYLVPFVKYYVTGYRILGYWYIPFAIVLFSLSPLFMAFIRLRPKEQLLVTGLLVMAALFIHRPIHGTPLTVLHSVAYFTPVYCIGIMGSRYRRYIYLYLAGREYWLLALVLGLALLQSLTGPQGSSFKPVFEFSGVDLMFLQKVAFCFFLLVWLHRFEKRRWPVMGLLATYSFGIFFTHTLFMSAFIALKERYRLFFNTDQAVVLFPFAVCCVLLLSVGATFLVCRLFPRHSRYLVGS